MEDKTVDREVILYWLSDRPWDLMIEALERGNPSDAALLKKHLLKFKAKVQRAIEDDDVPALEAALEEAEAFIASRRS